MATKKNLTPSQRDDQSSKDVKSVSDNTGLATSIIERWNKLENQRNVYMSQWENIGRYIMPRKSYILSQSIVPNMDRETQLFTSCGINANQILAAGCMAYITPADSRWFSYQSPEDIEDQPDVAEYFARVTEIVAEYLANSNFYTTVHELYLDRGAFATAVMHVEPGDTDDTPLIFRTFDVGKFCLAENHERLVDTLFFRDKFTVRALVMQFGIENVSPKTRKAYELPNGAGYDEEVEVIHGIFPRTDDQRDKSKKDGKNKPWASVYVEVAAKHALRNGGYDEKPFFATRYLTWQKSVYGYGPAWVALPTLRQLNLLEKNQDTLAELAANPRVLIPDGMQNAVDLRAGGATYFDASNPAAKPTEWATQGRYDIGVDRIGKKEKQVEEMFSVPLFQQFTQEDEQASGSPITATEVRARQAEQMANFNPTFSRLTTELLTPLLHRVYGILIRLGAFPPPPKALIQQNPKGELYLPDPKVVFNSRIALAVKSMEVSATDRSLQRGLQIVQITQDPSPLDVFNFDNILKGGALSDGVDPDYLRSADEVQQIRQARQQAAAAQAQMQQQAHMADMAQKAGSIKSDSPLGQQLAQNAPEVGSAY